MAWFNPIRSGIAETMKGVAGGLRKPLSLAKPFKLYPPISVTGKAQLIRSKITEVVKAPKETPEGNDILSSILSGSKKTNGYKPNKNNGISPIVFLRVLMSSWTIAGFLYKVREISCDTTERIAKFFDKVKGTLKGLAALLKLFWNWKDASISDFLAFGGKILLVLFAVYVVYVVWKSYIKRRYVVSPPSLVDTYMVSPPSLVDALGTNSNPLILQKVQVLTAACEKVPALGKGIRLMQEF